MEIRNRSNGELTTVSQFKSTKPNTSFPQQITTDILDSYGYDVVLNGPQATVTAPYGRSTRSGVEQIDGKWFTKFVAGPIFANSDEETAYKAKVDADVATSVRLQRDEKLADCDWTQTNDSPLKAESTWTTYRQALRDVPTQAGFPHNVTWPTKPT